MRNAIPDYCFKPSLTKSFFYLFRDLALVSGLMTAAFKFIPLMENAWLRYLTWALYGWVQGLAMTGIWVSRVSLLDRTHRTQEPRRSSDMSPVIRISQLPISSMILWDGLYTPLYSRRTSRGNPPIDDITSMPTTSPRITTTFPRCGKSTPTAYCSMSTGWKN